MAKKGGFRVMLAVTLAVGTVLLGCPTETEEEKDTWSTVSSLKQMNGTWKGSYSQTMTIRQAMEENGETWTSEMQTVFGDMKVAVDAEITTTINASAKTQALSMTMTQTYSGGNIDMAWSMISGGYSDQTGVTVDNEKHSITMTQSSPAQTVTDEEIAQTLGQGLQVNQNGKK